MSDEDRDFAGLGSDGDLDFSGIVGKKKGALSDDDDFDTADLIEDDDFDFYGDLKGIHGEEDDLSF